MAAYCSQCGEKRRDRTDWKLSSIASEAFAEITNLEHSKLWQTFRLFFSSRVSSPASTGAAGGNGFSAR